MHNSLFSIRIYCLTFNRVSHFSYLAKKKKKKKKTTNLLSERYTADFFFFFVYMYKIKI